MLRGAIAALRSMPEAVGPRAQLAVACLERWRMSNKKSVMRIVVSALCLAASVLLPLLNASAQTNTWTPLGGPTITGGSIVGPRCIPLSRARSML